jgi:hypothetical protein
VKNLVRSWRPLVRAVALALIVAAVPLPALAGDTPQAAPKAGIRASIDKVVAAQPVAPPPSRGQAAGAQSGNTVDLNSPSFFKTPAGIMVIAVIAAGAGYAIYSASNDRIHSPGR